MASNAGRQLHKPFVIEYIFQKKYNSATATWNGSPVVTFDEVAQGIRDIYNVYPNLTGKKLSDNNAANFFKDIIRKPTRNNQWPQSVLDAGYTGDEAVYDGNSFEFMPLPPGQKTAWIASDFPMPPSGTPEYRIQSLSIPLASRNLGWPNEPWVMQTVVALKLVESHLALQSQVPGIIQVDHLQMSVKRRKVEIDSLYLATRNDDDIIITVEAKGKSDDILPTQVLRQVRESFKLRSVDQQYALPLAVKVVGKSLIYIVEFELTDNVTASNVRKLNPVAHSLFRLCPNVPGIG